jgi:hypothetical protein
VLRGPVSRRREDPRMDGLAHIFLHVALCKSIARLPEGTPIAMHVQMAYPHGDPPYDKTLNLVRGDENELVVEFDVPRSEYHLAVAVPKYSCSSSSFVTVFADQNRKIAATLSEDPPGPPPLLLLDGTAPTSFLYLKPTYVLFDSTLTCNQPIPATPLTAVFDIDYDQGAYYLTMYADPSLQASAPVFTFRLRTPTGLAHYVRLPIKLPPGGYGWPSSVQFNITEDMIDGLATEKTGVLLCPKIWGTSAG